MATRPGALPSSQSRLSRELRATLGPTPGLWGREVERRATHRACFFLLSMVSMSSSSTVVARMPATEPMTMTVFLWRKRRSCKHGTVLFRASTGEDTWRASRRPRGRRDTCSSSKPLGEGTGFVRKLIRELFGGGGGDPQVPHQIVGSGGRGEGSAEGGAAAQLRDMLLRTVEPGVLFAAFPRTVTQPPVPSCSAPAAGGSRSVAASRERVWGTL